MSSQHHLKEISEGKFFIADKPPNLLSHETTSIVGKLLCNKAGHSGTLDPKVSGVLIIGLGKATRLLRFLTEQPKAYVGIAKFPKTVSKKKVEQTFSSLTGEIVQTPPEKSAVAKKPRKRRVYSLEALEIEKNRVLFKTVVEKGTYIRVLCEQMGAEMEDLRRVESGGISEEKSTIMQKLLDAVMCFREGNCTQLQELLWTPERVFEESSLPRVIVNEKASENLIRGAPLYAPGVLEVRGNVSKGVAAAVFDVRGSFIGVGRATTDYVGQKKGLLLKMERIHLN